MLFLCQESESQSILDDEASHEAQFQNGHRLLRLSSTRSRLFIDCVEPADAGVYQCVAETPTKRIVSTTVLEVGEHLLLSAVVVAVYCGWITATRFVFRSRIERGIL